LSSKYRILGQAKDADGSALVPWHFYYFPFTDVQKQGANHPSAKYDQRFSGAGANAWELTNYWKSEMDSGGSRGAGLDGHGITDDACAAYNAYNKSHGSTYTV